MPAVACNRHGTVIAPHGCPHVSTMVWDFRPPESVVYAAFSGWLYKGVWVCSECLRMIQEAYKPDDPNSLDVVLDAMDPCPFCPKCFEELMKQGFPFVAVLCEALELLKADSNDFTWSHWRNEKAATAEMRGHMDRLMVRDYSQVDALSKLFGPTGSLQEVSVSSGWGDRFLKLAESFDQELTRFRGQKSKQ